MRWLPTVLLVNPDVTAGSIFLHPDYQDYFEAHLREVLGRYPCDGLFMDMLMVHADADWGDHAIAFREKHHLMAHDRLTHMRYETTEKIAFASRFTSLIREKAPGDCHFLQQRKRLVFAQRFWSAGESRLPDSL